MYVLNATENAAEWDAVVKKTKIEDVHFTSAYARVQEKAGGTAFLFVDEFVHGEMIVQPFLMQPIAGTPYSDIRSLYGFGGPISNVGEMPFAPTLGGQFSQSITAWARQNGVVAEYCCLHPLLAPVQLPLVKSQNVQFAKNAVVIEDLDTFNGSRVSRRVRRACDKARERCVIIKADAVVTFAHLYEQSMRRLCAGVRWRYDLDYWQAHLDEDVGAQFFYLNEGFEPRRALLVVGKPPVAYAHFLGSDGEARDAGFDDILYFDVAQALGNLGYKSFHLGGGLTADENDPLLRFKSSFSDSFYAVGNYTRVFQPDIYDALTQTKADDEIAFHGRMSEQPWFPAYRREFA